MAAKTPSISELSSRIQANTATVEAWLAKNGHKAPSFHQDADTEFPTTVGDETIDAARSAILVDTQLLHDLVAGPGEVVRKTCWGAIDNAVQQVIYHFGFLTAIPLNGGATYEEISAKTGLALARVKSFVRQSALNRILYEDSPNHVVHSASSALLLKDKAMNDWYGHCVEELFPTAAKMADALDLYKDSVNPADSAFCVAFNTRQPIFEWFAQHPERQARFFGTMDGVGKDPGHSLDHVINGYSWDKVEKVADVGGSAGFVSIALANAFPNIKKFIVQDYEHTVKGGEATLPASLKGRVDFVPHDFFAPQPTPDADAYILRHICHNWSTPNSAKILSPIVKVMKPTARIILCEVVVTPSRADGPESERYMRNVDIAMLQMLNVQERSAEEWQEVVEATDPKLEIKAIHRPKGSWDSLIEIGFKN